MATTQALNVLKAEWDKIQPVGGTHAWYSKYFAEHVTDSGLRGTPEWYGIALAYYWQFADSDVSISAMEQDYAVCVGLKCSSFCGRPTHGGTGLCKECVSMEEELVSF